MTFVSGYLMVFYLFKLEQILILCNTMASSSIIVSKKDRVWPRNAIITDCRPTNGTVRKGHKEGIIQALTVQYICIFQVPFPFDVNMLCLDKTMICLDLAQPIRF